MATSKTKRGREESDAPSSTQTPVKQNGAATNGHSNGTVSKADRAVMSNGKGIKRETYSSDDESDSEDDSDMSGGDEKTKVKKENDVDDSDSDSDSSDDDNDDVDDKPNGTRGASLSDSSLDSDDSDDDDEDEDEDEDDGDNDEHGIPKHHSTLRPGQHEDESDDEYALMRCDDPYPPMDFQNRARCDRFIKKKATDLKRIFMHKQVRLMRSIRRKYKEEGKSGEEAEADPKYAKHHATYKLLEKYKVDVLCKLAWEYYWEKNKRVKFPKDVEPPLTADMKYWISEGLTHTLMRLAFQQITRAHLHKLKRQARKIIKAVNRQDRKDAKMTTQMKVTELTGLLAEANKEISAKIPKQNVDQLKIGQVVEAIVDTVGEFGVFVVFWRGGEEIKGMVHVSELSDRYTADVASHFHVGDKLNPVIINVDPARHKVSLSMRPTYYPDGVKPSVEHIAVHMRQAALDAQQQRNSSSTSQSSAGLSSVFLDRLRDTLQLDDEQLAKIKSHYQLANGVKLSKNRMGQKARRRLAEEVLGWQRKLRKNERPLTKKQVKKAKRKEEDNMRRGIMPLTEEEKEEKRKFELAEKKARALRKYDKNKDRNKARKAEERRKKDEKERLEREKKVKAKMAEAAAGGVQDQPSAKKRKVAVKDE